jgi:5'-3' exonuclease
MDRSLIIDANNILYRTFFAQIDEAEDVVIGMCHHSALWSMNKYYREYPADEIVMAFDSHSWRKAYTSDLSECVTDKKYKGTRRKNLTASQLKKLEKFDQHVTEFADMMRTQTSILTLKANHLEADDLIAGYIQERPNVAHVLISSDKDYLQLLGKHSLTLIDPDSGKPRSLIDWNNDPNYFMFSKCLRGDTSDNVMSAYPYIRTKRIEKAYTDSYELEAVMNHEFTALVNQDDGSVKECKYITRDVYEENDYLMNLESQPEVIRKIIKSSIEKSKEDIGKFNYSAFLKFCGKYELKNILDKVDQFIPMLAGKRIR